MRKILLYFVLVVSPLLLTSQDFWQNIPIPDTVIIASFNMDNTGTMYLGSRHSTYTGGLYRSTDFGQSWEYLAFYNNTVYAIELDDQGNILVGLQGYIFKSDDNGYSWDSVFYSIMNFTRIKYHPSGKYLAGGPGNLHGIYESVDYGETWDTCFLFSYTGDEYIRSITFNDNNDIYIGTDNIFGNSGIYTSADNGQNWEVFPSPCDDIFGLGFHPQGDFFVGSLGNGLYRYHYTSQNWTNDLYNVTPQSFCFIGNDSIFIGLDMDPNFIPGVLFSADGGANYDWLNSGMPGNGEEVIEFVIAPNGYLYAVGKNLFRSHVPLITILNDTKVSQKINLSNHPNPFSNSTTIKWETNMEDLFVRLTISDLQGYNIFERKVRNNGQFTFDGIDYPPGIYLYSISSSKLHEFNKMVLVK